MQVGGNMDKPKVEEVAVTAETKDCFINGDVVKREGYKGRLSDIVNEDKRFISLTSVEVIYKDTSKPKKNLSFLCLNKDAIIMFYPSDKK